MTEQIEPQRIVRVLAFALRHQPLRFGVALDDEGFAGLDDLVVGIRFSHYDWATLDRHQVEAAVRGTDPGRFEVRDGLVRARYGHSVALGSPGEVRPPPDVLLHGTSADAAPTVLATALRPMNRAFVHLTTNPDYATQVVAAKGGGVVIRVRAREAAAAGVEFFQANPHVWLAREVPSPFLRIDDDDPAAPQGRRTDTAVVT
ncbi:MAG: RNA 2'-phosphotransferase [Gemmataceae bacterium]|nr:RNA 2'-phosphotransferase [Gemmataceae bacterium]